jgi:predicted RNA polymerase sigma factor
VEPVDPVSAAVVRAFRDGPAIVLDTLIRQVGDFQLAVGVASGPAGLALLEPLLGDPALERYQPLHSAHAEPLGVRATPRAPRARTSAAIALSGNAVERTELERRPRALR